ncbi:PfkB family carbohydrate kinase [Bosea caraganae]|nr:PfkB family carbohydrate kinase [Bosea caraganae]
MGSGGVLVYGEALADLVPEDAGAARYEALLGGSGFNTALTLARCGAPVSYCATLSHDALGRRFRARLEQDGIDLRFLAESDKPTPLAVVAPLGTDGAARYHFHLARTTLDEPPPLPASFDGIAHLHLTSFGATVGASGERALELMRAARAAGLSLSYDLNIRPPALPGPEEILRLIEERVTLCDLVKLSIEDAEQVFGAGYETVVARWLSEGRALVLLTEGDHGAHLVRARGERVRGYAPVTELVDTIGAGDAFMGGFLASVARAGELGPALRSLSDEAAASAMDVAARVAAETCGRRGCDPPRLTPELPSEQSRT